MSDLIEVKPGAPWHGQIGAPQQFVISGSAGAGMRVICSELFGPIMLATDRADYPGGIRRDPGGWWEEQTGSIWVAGPADNGYAECSVIARPKAVNASWPGYAMNGAQTWKPRAALPIPVNQWVQCGGPSTGAFRVIYRVTGPGMVYLGNFLDNATDKTNPLEMAFPLYPGEQFEATGNSALLCYTETPGMTVWGMKFENARNWSWK